MDQKNTAEEKMALFRYTIIVPAISGDYTEKNLKEFFFKQASKEHELPDGTKKYFSPYTIKKWYYHIRKPY